MFQNPHPFGNEYHTIACGLTVYFLFGYMVEGMDDNTYLKQSKLVKKGVGGDVFSQSIGILNTIHHKGNFYGLRVMRVARYVVVN